MPEHFKLQHCFLIAFYNSNPISSFVFTQLKFFMLKLSQYPFHTIKDVWNIEESESSNLLVQAWYIRQEVAWAYNYLPLWVKVLDNIKKIIKKNLESIGSQEILMTAIGARKHWEQTGRDNMDILFKIEFSDWKHNFLNPTHEEVVTPLVSEFIKSYKDLPLSVFQIQTKFRNEKRAKSGILRGREFLMKDMYSFHKNQEDMDKYYEKVINTYKAIFEELWIGDDTYLTYASWGDFSQYSHEFQTLTPLGEDIVYVDKKNKIALNKEIIDDPKVKEEFKDYNFTEEKWSEVWNIFKLGTKFTNAFDMHFADETDNLWDVLMWCYGIGISRTMWIIAEKTKDKKWLVRPKNIAPYDVYVLAIWDENINQECLSVIANLEEKWLSVIYDDRSISPWIKLKDSDLLGIPARIIISDKSLRAGWYEYQKRSTSETIIIENEKIIDFLM